MDRFDLTGKVALVTGCNSGMGREIANLFSRRGAKVFLASRREARLLEVKAEIEAAGGTAACKVTDVAKEADCKAAVEACIAAFGRLDILVNSAGIGFAFKDLETEFSAEYLDPIMAIDFGGTFYMIKYAYPEMNKVGGGSIVSISSNAAMKCFGVVPYSAAKGAIRAMDRSLAGHFGAMNIRINSIYPGTVTTEMSEKDLESPELVEYIKAYTPMKRVGTVEDIAYAALYLASDASTYVTGQALIVDGGGTC